MKAINYFILNIIGLSLFVSCKPQDQQQHDLDSYTKAYFEVNNNSKFKGNIGTLSGQIIFNL